MIIVIMIKKRRWKRKINKNSYNSKNILWNKDSQWLMMNLRKSKGNIKIKMTLRESMIIMILLEMKINKK